MLFTKGKYKDDYFKKNVLQYHWAMAECILGEVDAWLHKPLIK